MLDRKKLTRLLIVALVFLAADAWIYLSLRGAFRSIMSETRFKEISLFAKTAPRDSSGAVDWLKSANEVLPGSRAVFLAPDAAGKLAFVAGDPGLAGMLRDKADQADFKKGFDSVFYLEPFATTKDYSLPAAKGGAIAGRLYFAPVPDDSGADIRGALVILSSGSATERFDGLLLSLAIVAAVLFLAIYIVISFSRDPVMGFAILVLFGLMVVFVAYPLL